MTNVREAHQVGKPIVYFRRSMSECTQRCRQQCFYELSDIVKEPSEVPSVEGEFLIILHAGHKCGFVQDCCLGFIGNTKWHDYHEKFNYKHFTE